MKSSPRSTRNERGAVLIWLAFFLLIMLFFVGLGIDGAKLAATRVQLQNAADAAALAGATAVDSVSVQAQLVQADARVRATQTANENPAFIDNSQPVVLQAGDIEFPQPTEIKVTTVRSPERGNGVVAYVSHTFSGRSSNQMRATATAKVEPANQICDGLVPMGAIPPDQSGFIIGCNREYPLKWGAGNSTNGNFQLLRFPDCNEGACAGMNSSGANTLNCLVHNGYGCCIDIGQCIDTEPGNKVGQFKTALNDRFNEDTDQREDICYEQYRGNKKRLIVVPNITPPGNGTSTQVCVTGFSAFFLKRRVTGGGLNSEVSAEFVRAVAPGSSNGNGGNGTVYAIRLIK